MDMMDFFMNSKVNEISTASHPTEPLGKKSFCKVWFNQRLTLYTSNPGSAYCDTCTMLTNNSTGSCDENCRDRDFILLYKTKHRDKAKYRATLPANLLATLLTNNIHMYHEALDASRQLNLPSS